MKLSLDSISNSTIVEVKKVSKRIWSCDWIILSYLKDIAPVYDANMWRIYAAEFNKSLDFLTEDDMVELCNANKNVIDMFITGNVIKRLVDIVNHWKNFAQIADDSFLGMNIPTSAVNAFKAFLSFHKNDDVKDDEVSRNSVFTQLRAELLVSGVSYENADARYPLSIEEFRAFMKCISYEFQNITNQHNVTNTTASDYRSRLQKCIELVKTVLLICMGDKVDKGSNYSLQLFEDLICWGDTMGKKAQIVRKATALGNLTLAHAVCLYSTSNVDFKSDDEGSKITDTFRFIVTTLLQDDFVSSANETFRGAVSNSCRR